MESPSGSIATVHGSMGTVGIYGQGRKIPAGAIVLSEGEVLEMQMKLIQKWEPRTEIWPYTYGAGITGGLSVMTGMFGNFHYRRVLRLLHYGRASTYAPAVILPTISAIVLHNVYVSQPILLQQFDCAVCAEVRSACVQTFAGFLIPWTVATLGCLALAKTKHTVPVPHLLNIKAFSEFLWKKTRPANVNMMGLVGVNFLGAMFIANYEMRVAPKIWQKMGITDAPEQPQQTETSKW